MGQKMSNAPIFYTLGQIRFSPVLGMAKFVDEIQDKLRGSFPDFRAEQRRRLQLADAGDGTELKSEATTRWHFIDQANTSGFVLEQSALTFHTTAYETSTWFFDHLLHGLEVIHSFASLSYIQRLGVRTLDAIVPKGSESLDTYLQTDMLGLYRLLPGELKHNINEVIFSIGTGTLISRLIVMKGSLAVPADLFPVSLTIKPELQNLDTLHAVLDIDRSDEGKVAVEMQEVGKRLQMIKRDVTAAFEKMVTSAALQHWR